MNDLLTNYGLPIISFIIVLGPLIFIHEFGHFIALRLTGVTVLEFGIGFPPRAIKLFEQGGTIFSLNWLPIGGFVRPLGEDFVRPVGETATEQDRAAFEQYQKEMEALGKKVVKTKSLLETNPWQRIFFFIAGIVMNLIGAFVLLTVVALLGQPSPGVGIAMLPSNTPAAQAGLQVDDVITAINGKQVNSIKDVNDDKNYVKELGQPIKVDYERNGQPGTTTVTLGTSFTITQEVVISEVVKDSPANVAGLLAGDAITQLSVKGDDKATPLKVVDTQTLQDFVKKYAGQVVTVSFIRGSDQKQADLTPRQNPPANEGPMGITIGATTYYAAYGWNLVDTDAGRITKLPLGAAIQDGFQQTGFYINQVFGAPIALIAGKIRPQDARPGSVVAISQIGGDLLATSIRRQEPYPILRFAAIISISLAFVNLLPIPGLDGGRILFVIFELVRGKPMDPEREGFVHMIGLLALLALSAILIINDIINPITNSLPK